MIFVVAEELTPDQAGGNVHLATAGVIVGFAVMMTLDVALGLRVATLGIGLPRRSSASSTRSVGTSQTAFVGTTVGRRYAPLHGGVCRDSTSLRRRRSAAAWPSPFWAG
jgi:hypothetical protein